MTYYVSSGTLNLTKPKPKPYYYYYYYYFLIPSGVKIPRVKSKVKSKRKAEVVTPRR